MARIIRIINIVNKRALVRSFIDNFVRCLFGETVKYQILYVQNVQNVQNSKKVLGLARVGGTGI